MIALDSMFDLIPAALVLTDAHGRVVRANPAGRQLLGDDEALCLTDEMGVALPFPCDDVDGRLGVRWVRAQSVRVDDGWLCTLTDVTAWRSRVCDLETVLDASADCAYIKSVDGTYRYANPAAGRLLGRRPEDIVGQRDEALFEQSEAARITALYAGILAEASTRTFDQDLLVDGQTLSVQTTKGVLRDGEAAPHALFGITRNLTHERQAEAQLRRSLSLLQATLEATVDAIYVCDLQGRTVTCNRQFARLWNLPYETIAEMDRDSLRAVIIGMVEDPTAVIAAARDIEADPERVIADLIHLRDGRVFERITQPKRRDGQVVGRVYCLRDVTDRERALAALREREAKYRGLLETMIDGYWLVDLEGHVLEVNDVYVRQSGYSREELLSMRIPQLDAREDPAEVEARMAAIKSRGSLIFETRHRRKDGTTWPCEVAVCYSPVGGGRIFAVFRDISERRRADQKLRRSEENLRRAQAVSHTGSWHIDFATGVHEWSEENYRIFGENPETPITFEYFFSRVHPDDVDSVRTAWTRAVEQREPYDVEHRITVDGAVRWVREVAEIQYDVQGKPVTVIGVTHDITATKQADAAVRESEGRYRSLVETTFDWIWEVDADAVYTYTSERVRDLLGYEPHEVLGMTPFDFMLPAEAEKVRTAFFEFAVQRQLFSSLQNINFHKTGRMVVLETSALPMFGPKGEFLGYRGADRDVTERYLAQEALRTSEERLRMALEGAQAMSWEADVETMEFEESGAVAALFGETDPGFRNHTVASVQSRIPPDDLPMVREAMAATVEHGAPYNVTHRLLWPDGQVRWIHSTGQVRRNEQGRPTRVVGIARDVTREMRAEETRRASQKMEALGTLAGGIAHDFNNILLAISGNATLALDEVEENSAAHVCLTEIVRASTRAADLVRNILHFSHPRSRERSPLEIGPIVQETICLLRASLPARIKLEVSSSTDLPWVSAEATQVHQVVVNLVTNAWHAIEGDGCVRVSVEPVEEETGSCLRLTVSDDGCGMDEKVRSRVFDPYFTTRPPGEGTGLGLSIVNSIVDQLGGRIEVQSRVGEGSTFTVTLPACSRDSDTPTVEATVPRLLKKARGERVLYLDDEPGLVFLVSRLLTRCGYTVVGHTHASQALSFFHADPHAIDVLVTDLSMPGRSGLEVAAEVLAVRPRLPVVLTTGYLVPESQEQASQIGIRHVVLKPDTVEELGEVLQRLLEDTDLEG